MHQTVPFRKRAHRLADGTLMEWGVRRIDGSPWRTEKSHKGDTRYYTLGDEVSADGLILHAADALDAISIQLSQHEDESVLPQPGEVTVVRRVFRSFPGNASPEWDYWWVDEDPNALINHLTRTIQACTLYLPKLAALITERAANQ